MFVCVIDGSKGLSFDVMELGRKKKQTPGRESVLYNVVLWRGDQVGRGDSSSSSRVRSFGPVTRSTCWVTGCPLAPEKHGLSGPWRRPWLSKPASCTITSAHRLSFTSRHAVSTRKKNHHTTASSATKMLRPTQKHPTVNVSAQHLANQPAMTSSAANYRCPTNRTSW